MEPMTATVIVDAPRGSVETHLNDTPEAELLVWAGMCSPDAVAELARRRRGKGSGTSEKLTGTPSGRVEHDKLEKVRLPRGVPRDWTEHPWTHGWVWHGPTEAGTSVEHSSYGKGKIVRATNARIHVDFGDGKIRTFKRGPGAPAKPAKPAPSPVSSKRTPKTMASPATAKAPRRAKRSDRSLTPVVDRSGSPEQVLALEAKAQSHALAAPPVKFQDLAARQPRGKAVRALKYYQRHGDQHMNSLLRKGKVSAPPGVSRSKIPSPEQVQAQVETLDRLMEESRLAEPITTYRGVSEIRRMFRGADEPGSLVGRAFTDRGFTSTSANRAAAEQFMPGESTRSAGALVEVRVPAGVGAIQISNDEYVGAGADPGWGESEREILLQRGLRYRIVSDEMRSLPYRFLGEARMTEPVRYLVVEVVAP